MKIRLNFVSNSSSASFVIIKDRLTEEQKRLLLEYPNSEENYDGWNITEEKCFINGFTIMDNGSITNLFETINIDPDIISYDD